MSLSRYSYVAEIAHVVDIKKRFNHVDLSSSDIFRFDTIVLANADWIFRNCWRRLDVSSSFPRNHLFWLVEQSRESCAFVPDHHVRHSDRANSCTHIYIWIGRHEDPKSAIGGSHKIEGTNHHWWHIWYPLTYQIPLSRSGRKEHTSVNFTRKRLICQESWPTHTRSRDDHWMRNCRFCRDLQWHHPQWWLRRYQLAAEKQLCTHGNQVLTLEHHLDQAQAM